MPGGYCYHLQEDVLFIIVYCHIHEGLFLFFIHFFHRELQFFLINSFLVKANFLNLFTLHNSSSTYLPNISSLAVSWWIFTFEVFPNKIPQFWLLFTCIFNWSLLPVISLSKGCFNIFEVRSSGSSFLFLFFSSCWLTANQLVVALNAVRTDPWTRFSMLKTWTAATVQYY